MSFSKRCQNGTVQLKKISYPKELKQLFTLHFFREHVRLYNNLFAFTNNFANFDKKMFNLGVNKGAYTLKLRGKVSHSIPPTLLPTLNKEPMFSQIYIYDALTQLEQRTKIQKKAHNLILQPIHTIMKKNSPVVDKIPTLKHINTNTPERIRITPLDKDNSTKDEPQTDNIGLCVDEFGKFSAVIVWTKSNEGLKSQGISNFNSF